MSFISIKNFCLERDSKQLYKDFSLEIEQGSVVGLFAPSGSGKTSLLNYICGNLENSENTKISGEINFSQQVQIAYCFQDLRLLENQSVYKNILIPVIKNKNSKVEEKILDYLNQFDLADKRNKKVCKLSGGEKQRVSIIRALIYPSNLLLLDECFTFLDEEIEAKALGICKNYIQENKITTIVVSHKKSVLEYLCSEIIEISNC